MNKKIIFRADGNELIGLGHLYRLLAIAEMVKEQFDVQFVTSVETLKTIIPKEFLIKEIPNNIDEIKWIFKNYPSEEFLIVLDGYQFNAAYQQNLKKLGYTLVYMDDLVEEYMYADVVINHSPTVTKTDYNTESYTKLALGTKYSLLRPSFLQKASQFRNPKKCDTCFICFGGADMFNLTEKAVKALIGISDIKRVHIVLGGANLNTGVYEMQSDSLIINIYQNIGEKKLCGIMSKCNIAIVPASTISYEVCAVKMPILGGYYVENQKGIYKGLVQNGAIFGGGDFRDYSENDFKEKIQELLIENKTDFYIENQARLFDSGIKNRIVDLFVNIQSGLIQIRRVKKDDVETLFRWSNDKQVRLQSFSSQKISYENHCRWFKNKLTDKNAILFIIEIDYIPAGIVRFEIDSETSTIGISIDEKYRGKGLGNRFLKLALNTYFLNKEKSVLAFVKKDNVASIKSFEKAGFRYLRNEVISGVHSKVFVLDKNDINE